LISGRQVVAQARLAIVPRVPLLSRLDDGLRAMRDPVYGKRMREEATALQRLKENLGGRFADLAPVPGAKSFIMYGFGRVDMALLERIVAAGFEHAGMIPVIVGPWHSYGAAAYRCLGLGRLNPLATQVSVAARLAADRAIAGIQQKSELHVFEYDGVPCGKIAMSSLMRSQRQGRFNLDDVATRHILADALARSIGAVEAARKLLRRHRPAALVLSDRGYTPFGEMSYLCMEGGIPVYTWNVAHRNGRIVMKRFGKHNSHLHHHSLSFESWRRISELNWCAAYQAASERELTDSYTSGEWYGEVGTQFHVSSVEKQALIERLKLDPNKKTVVLFPHIFWDGTFFWGEDLFDDYEEWYCEVLKVARDNTRLNWVIKIHPANIVKDVRDKHSAEHSEVTVMRQVLGETPGHIRLIEASSDISTLSLFSIMDYCLTVRGTIGIEAAYRGIPVLTAGTGRYDRLGFTVDFDDRKSYLARLRHLETVPSLTTTEWELAKKYAFGTFALRPTPLSSLQFSFRKDAVASLEASLTVANLTALRSAPDIAALGEWIHSGEDDFCNWALAEQVG